MPIPKIAPPQNNTYKLNAYVFKISLMIKKNVVT